MLTSKIKETIEHEVQFNFGKPQNYLWCCYEKDTFAPLSLTADGGKQGRR